MTPTNDAPAPAPSGVLDYVRSVLAQPGIMMFQRSTVEDLLAIIDQHAASLASDASPRGEASAVTVRFSDAREPEIVSWRMLPKGEHHLYAHPAPATVEMREALLKAREYLAGSNPLNTSGGHKNVDLRGEIDAALSAPPATGGSQTLATSNPQSACAGEEAGQSGGEAHRAPPLDLPTRLRYRSRAADAECRTDDADIMEEAAIALENLTGANLPRFAGLKTHTELAATLNGIAQLREAGLLFSEVAAVKKAARILSALASEGR